MTTSKVVIKTMRTNVILRDLDEFEDYKDLNILCEVRIMCHIIYMYIPKYANDFAFLISNFTLKILSLR